MCVEGRSPLLLASARCVPGEVEHELFVALGLARTTLARHAYALVAAGAAHLHEGSLGDGVEVWRTLVEVLQERGCRARVQSAGAARGEMGGVGWGRGCSVGAGYKDKVTAGGCRVASGWYRVGQACFAKRSVAASP